MVVKLLKTDKSSGHALEKNVQRHFPKELSYNSMDSRLPKLSGIPGSLQWWTSEAGSSSYLLWAGETLKMSWKSGI